MTQPDYIEQRDNGYWIVGTRVSLDSVVYRFLEGLSPETIQADCFLRLLSIKFTAPSLTT